MKVIEKYIVVGLLMFSLRIDSSAYDQLALVDPKLTERLNRAIRDDNINEVEKLVEQEHMSPEQLNSLDSDGWAALHRAAWKSNPKIMEILLQHKADPNVRFFKRNAKSLSMEESLLYPGATPLFFVARGASDSARDNHACFNMLVGRGADLTVTNFWECTLLHILAMYYNVNWLNFMDQAIEAGVNPNAQINAAIDPNAMVRTSDFMASWSALHLLARSHNPYSYVFAKKLIENGADRYIEDFANRTPLSSISSTNPNKEKLQRLFAKDKVNDDELGIVDSIVSKNTKKNAERGAVLESDAIRDKKHNKTLRFNDDAAVRYYNKNDDAWNDDAWDDVWSLTEAENEAMNKIKLKKEKNDKFLVFGHYDDDDI